MRGAWPTPLYVTGCGIAPGVSYEIRSWDGTKYSTPLDIDTTPKPTGPSHSWGDLTGGPDDPPSGYWSPPDGVTNMTDIQGALRSFEGNLSGTGAPRRVHVDLEINRAVNLGDIQFLVWAFEGVNYVDIPDLKYIGVHPADCPEADPRPCS
jgi:hypothetical protein